MIKNPFARDLKILSVEVLKKKKILQKSWKLSGIAYF